MILKNKWNLLLIATLSAFIAISCQPQKSQENACIAFYNLENLFDTINEEGVADEEFTPEGKKAWTPDRYLEKLDHMGRVFHEIGLSELNPDGAALIGVCELENKSVLQDLANTEILKDRNYLFVHYDSPYYRGMDVALFYQPKYFTVLSSSSHELNMPEIENYTTRAQLLVSGILNGDTIHVIVNHWPSRRGGEEKSRHLRIAAAELCRSIADSIFMMDEDAKIIIMGDLNDDPHDPSVKKYLRTSDKTETLGRDEFYNPYESIHTDSVGTLMYRGKWNLFDQILLSHALSEKESSSYSFDGAFIYKEDYLIQQDGKYKGSPFRTYSWDNYISGYSDHLPVFVCLGKKGK